MDDMTIERWQDPEAAHRLGLKLAGSVTIAQAAELRDELLAAMDAAGELKVDLTGLTEIDLTGLQLLEACHSSAMSRGKLFAIEYGDNPAFLDTVHSAGFRRHVGCNKDKNGTCIWVGGEN